MPDDGRSAALGKGAELIRHYEAIARASRAMLVAARDDDWDRVARLEDECRALIRQLQAAAAAATSLGRAEQRRRVQLLREILADDAEMRIRSEPWLQQLEQMFTTVRRGARGSG